MATEEFTYPTGILETTRAISANNPANIKKIEKAKNTLMMRFKLFSLQKSLSAV